jgi:hypothetical protein
MPKSEIMGPISVKLLRRDYAQSKIAGYGRQDFYTARRSGREGGNRMISPHFDKKVNLR